MAHGNYHQQQLSELSLVFILSNTCLLSGPDFDYWNSLIYVSFFSMYVSMLMQTVKHFFSSGSHQYSFLKKVSFEASFLNALVIFLIF